MLRQLKWLLGFIVLLWLLAFIDLIPGVDLAQFGVVPRDRVGLRGIPVHVFVHSGFGHLLSNTVPLLILGGLIAMRKTRFLVVCSIFIVVFSGAGVWLVGRSATHIGASGLVFGYFGCLVALGFFERGCLSIIVALAVVAVYGFGILSGLLPLNAYVSWEGHLFGLIAGVLFAWFINRRLRERAGKR